MAVSAARHPVRDGPADGIPPGDYQAFCRFLEETAGITLGAGREYLVSSRLNGLMRDCGIAEFGGVLRRLRDDGAFRLRVIDAMTTNESSWFRDTYPFEILKARMFPALSGQDAATVRIWSAACSHGQEPYSIAMAVGELFPPGARPPLEVVATDISPSVLAHASAGCFDEMSLVRGLSDERRRRWFTPVDGGWRISEDLRRCVTFRRQNLLEDFSGLGRFDIVFCRNVLIYFPQERKHDILRRMAGAMNPAGFLVLGSSEVISPNAVPFEPVRCPRGIIYRPVS